LPTLLDGKYEVLSKIKEGGMGAIFMVRHVLLDEIRVIKTMRTQIEDDPDAKKRFYREAKLAKDLKHENIASFIDFFEDQDHTFYMVMDYIEGSNLSELIDRQGRLPLTTVLDISIQTADALGYLHKKGIIHRDISPENIMLTEDSEGQIQVKLIDLGVAKQTSQQTMTEAGIFVGKLKYGSPEQLGVLKKGEAIDGRSDLYSLGAVIYFALTGKHAFDAQTPQAYISQHLVRGPRPFPESDPEGRVPEVLRAIVMKSLAKNRQERFSSAEEMAATMREEREEMRRQQAGRDPASTDMRLMHQQTMAVFNDVHEHVIAKRRAVAPDPDAPTMAPSDVEELEDVPPTVMVDKTPTPAPRQQSKKEIWDFPTMHVDGPGAGIPKATPPPRPERSSGTPNPTQRVQRTSSTSQSAVRGTPTPSREVKSSPPKPTLQREESQHGTVGPSRKTLTIFGGAFVVLAAIAIGLVVSHAKRGGGPPGAVELTASPWARVVSVVDAGNGAEIPLTSAATPVRLELPPGAYRITVRGVAGGSEREQTAECQVTSAEVTHLHVTLQGFDLEAAVRTYVP